MLDHRKAFQPARKAAESRLSKFSAEGRALAALAFPIMLTQLLQNGLSFVDVIMAGNASAADLAGISLGGALYMPALLLVTGLLVVLSALVSHAIGADDLSRATRQTHQAIWLGLAAGLIGWLFCHFGNWWLAQVQVTPLVREKAVRYLAAAGFSLPALGLFQALRSYCEGFGRTRAVMILTGLGFLAHIPADYALVFGWGPIPALGGVGCGWATSFTCWFTLILIWGYTRMQGRRTLPSLYQNWVWPSRGEIAHLLGLGTPVALAIFFEASLFSVVSILIAHYGAVTLSGHQIAYNFSAMTYMIPLALGVAISVRCGYFLGRREPEQARFACMLGIGLAGVIAVFFAVGLYLGRFMIAGWFTRDPDVATMAASLLTMAALFQISDGLQASTSGALRGYRDTRAIMASTLVAYWGLGLPLGYVLARGLGIFPALGVKGYWCGLIIGLSAAALFLVTRLFRISRRHIEAAMPGVP